MRRVAAGFVALTLIVSSPAPALAYLKFGVRIGATVADLRWTQTIGYFVNEREVAGVSSSQFRDAIVRAFGTWQAVPSAVVRSQLLGSTLAAPGALDGRTTLGFLDRPDLERVLGATSVMLNAPTGEIIEADVFFNSRYDWSTAAGGQEGRVDLETVALHEIGHLLGLGHSAIGETDALATGGRRVIGSAAVMFPISMNPGSIADRVLTPDDVAGVSDLYPSSDAEATTGSIAGRVTKNGAGVFGAHIVAFNMETGALIGNFALDDSGRFVIAGLAPGPHLIRVEPLDDAEPSSFFTGSVDVNFQPTFAPKIVVAPRGGSSDELEIQVRSR